MQKLQSLKDAKFEPLSTSQMQKIVGGDFNIGTPAGTLRDGRKFECDHENYDSTGTYKNTTYTFPAKAVTK